MKSLEKYEVAGSDGLSLLVIAGAAFLLMGAIAAPALPGGADIGAKAPLVETVSVQVDAGVS